MKRAMIKIIDELCDGCGNCVTACAEGAIEIVDGKATVIDDRYCDGLGACLGDCPQDALIIEEREAPEFDEEAVKQHLATRNAVLKQWPVKLALLSPLAPFLQGADLVLAADCGAFAHGAFHTELLRDRPLAIACPKLDDPQLAVSRLTNLVQGAGLKSITILKMEVPCCGGLEMLARRACELAGRDIPISSQTIEIGPAFGGMKPVPGGGCPSSRPSEMN